MSTATLTAPHAATVVPSQYDVRSAVLRRVANHDKTLSKDVINHVLSPSATIPARLDIHILLPGMGALDDVLSGRSADEDCLADLFTMLSEVVSSATGKPRFNASRQRFERWEKVVTNSFGDTHYEWVPVR